MKESNGRKSQFAHLPVVAKGGTFALFGLVIGAGIQYFYNVLLGRGYGAEQAGHFIFALSIISVAAIVGQVGFQQTVIRYVATYWSSGRSRLIRGLLLLAFTLTIIASAIFAALLFMGADTIARLSDKPEASSILKIISVAIPLLALISLSSAAFQGVKRIDLSTIIQQIGRPTTILFAILIAGLIRVGTDQFEFFIWLFILGLLIITIASLFLTWHLFFKHPHEKRIQTRGREWTRFAGSVIFMDLFRSTAGWLDAFILGFLVAAAQLGVYYAAVRTTLLITIVLNATNMILAPVASDLWQRNDISQLDRVFKTTTRWTSMFALPLAICVILLRDELMAVFGDEYRAGSLILAIMIFGRLGNAFTGGVARILIMTGHERVELANNIIVVLVKVIAMIFVAQRYGIIGVAIVSVLVMIGANIMKLIEVKLLVGIHPYEFSYWKLFASSIAALIVGWIAYQMLASKSIIVVLLIVGSGVVVSFALMLVLLGLESEDKHILNQLFRRIRKVGVNGA